MAAHGNVDQNTSDGYHTFGELYEHRNTLFCYLCTVVEKRMPFPKAFWSRKHHDGTMYEGYIIVGLQIGEKLITYHMPIEFIKYLSHIPERDTAPPWDGHTSKDVLSTIQEECLACIDPTELY